MSTKRSLLSEEKDATPKSKSRWSMLRSKALANNLVQAQLSPGVETESSGYKSSVKANVSKLRKLASGAISPVQSTNPQGVSNEASYTIPSYDSAFGASDDDMLSDSFVEKDKFSEQIQNIQNELQKITSSSSNTIEGLTETVEGIQARIVEHEELVTHQLDQIHAERHTMVRQMQAIHEQVTALERISHDMTRRLAIVSNRSRFSISAVFWLLLSYFLVGFVTTVGVLTKFFTFIWFFVSFGFLRNEKPKELILNAEQLLSFADKSRFLTFTDDEKEVG
ncbi:hypothetical protein PCE1_003325 [Barthelona sp. PCE]